jgi:hypothetical protein
LRSFKSLGAILRYFGGGATQSRSIVVVAREAGQPRPPATKTDVETVVSSMPCDVLDPADGANLRRRFQQFQGLAATFHRTQYLSPGRAFIAPAFGKSKTHICLFGKKMSILQKSPWRRQELGVRIAAPALMARPTKKEAAFRRPSSLGRKRPRRAYAGETNRAAPQNHICATHGMQELLRGLSHKCV